MRPDQVQTLIHHLLEQRFLAVEVLSHASVLRPLACKHKYRLRRIVLIARRRGTQLGIEHAQRFLAVLAYKGESQIECAASCLQGEGSVGKIDGGSGS